LVRCGSDGQPVSRLGADRAEHGQREGPGLLVHNPIPRSHACLRRVVDDMTFSPDPAAKKNPWDMGRCAVQPQKTCRTSLEIFMPYVILYMAIVDLKFGAVMRKRTHPVQPEQIKTTPTHRQHNR